MGFFQKLKLGFQRFMTGRTGVDHLGLFLIWAGIILNFLGLIPYMGILGTIGTACYIYAFFRMLSRNKAKRYRENYWFVQKTTPYTTKARQAMVRFKNRKQYRYFNCLNCKSKLKLPRNVGEVTVTCGNCKHSFRKKA